MIEAQDIRSVRYMVSFYEFPEVDGEFDLRKSQEVIDILAEKVSEVYPNTVGRIWCDHPEYNSFPDFEVTVRADLELRLDEDEKLAEAKRAIEDGIRFRIEHEWLPAALDEAGVFEGEDDDDE